MSHTIDPVAREVPTNSQKTGLPPRLGNVTVSQTDYSNTPQSREVNMDVYLRAFKMLSALDAVDLKSHETAMRHVKEGLYPMTEEQMRTGAY